VSCSSLDGKKQKLELMNNSYKAAPKKKKRTAQKTAIYSLAYIYIKQVIH